MMKKGGAAADNLKNRFGMIRQNGFCIGPSQPFVRKAFVFCPVYDRILGKANRPAKRLCRKM